MSLHLPPAVVAGETCAALTRLLQSPPSSVPEVMRLGRLLNLLVQHPNSWVEDPQLVRYQRLSSWSVGQGPRLAAVARTRSLLCRRYHAACDFAGHCFPG